MRNISSNYRIIMTLMLLLCLGSCGNGALPASYGPETSRPPRGQGLFQGGPILGEVEPLGTSVAASLQRFPLPEGRKPLFHLSESIIYCLDQSAQVLLATDLVSGAEQQVLDLRDTGNTLAEEVACSERYLVWILLAPWREADGEPMRRGCSLMLRDLQSGTDVTLDTAEMTILDQPELPFDHLNLEGDYLAYRSSLSQNGARTTRIELQRLPQGESSVLAEARSESGRALLSCHLADGLLVWDLRTLYLESQGRLPARERAVYDLYCYQLNPTRLGADENPLLQLTVGDDYYSPRAYRQQILAVQQIEGDPLRTDALAMIYPSQSTVVSIIDPQSSFVQELSDRYGTILRRRGDYPGLPLRRFSYGSPYVDTRYASWQSNVADHHLLFDMETYRFAALPVEELQDGEHPADLEAPSFWLRPLPSFTKDVLLLGFVGELAPRYLLILE